ncbi:MAG: UDP-2,3-diacylglucosamine diphosphatase [Muribaculaceae bacterium]|nr:UDP-2,3-diacylglucosamine diphosphatase [Muribaculaceae bacterium]
MKKAYFFSDTHLGASFFPDSRQRELKVVEFLDYISKDASEIYLLGDILDYWYEYRYVVPRGFVRFFGKLAELSDRGVKITWLIGNHDIWIFDYLPQELGIEVIDGTLVTEIMGTRILMAHGDGVWQHSRQFRMLRALFRNKTCQRLFAAIHPRWTIPFAYAWSRHSRKGDMQKEEADIALPPFDPQDPANLTRTPANEMNFHIRKLYDFSAEYEKSNPDCKYFLYGHLHRMVQQALPGGGTMLILGDWINKFSYAEFDGTQMSMKIFRSSK